MRPACFSPVVWWVQWPLTQTFMPTCVNRFPSISCGVLVSMKLSFWKTKSFCGSGWGLWAYVVVHTILPPSPVILWKELGGKPKWLPLNFGYHVIVRIAPIWLRCYRLWLRFWFDATLKCGCAALLSKFLCISPRALCPFEDVLSFLHVIFILSFGGAIGNIRIFISFFFLPLCADAGITGHIINLALFLMVSDGLTWGQYYLMCNVICVSCGTSNALVIRSIRRCYVR